MLGIIPYFLPKFFWGIESGGFGYGGPYGGWVLGRHSPYLWVGRGCVSADSRVGTVLTCQS